MKTAKRFRAALLAFALVFALAACGAPAAEPMPAPLPTRNEASAPDAARDTPATSAPSEQNEAPARLPDTTASPDEPEPSAENSAPTCTVSISCTTILSSGFFAVPQQATKKASGRRKSFFIGKEILGIRVSFRRAMFPGT